MNTKHLATCITSCLLGLLCLAGCTEQELPAAPPAGQGQGLCFAVRQADTKMSYDNVRSDFEDNEAVGCIITVGDKYAVNSKWHYCRETGMLIFDFYWGNKTVDWQKVWSQIDSDDTDNDLINRSGSNPESDGYISLEREGIYNFYFYYPYVASDLLREEITNASNSYKALTYPNILTTDFTSSTDVYTQCYVTGEVMESGQTGASWSQTFTTYTWTNYPCFANHTQASQAQINNSDFLWVSRTGITSASNQTINLVFQKKMATIEVVSDVQLTDVYFQAQSAGNLRRGKEINLSTGKLTDYTNPTYDWEASFFQKNRYFTTDEHILPYDNSDGAGTDYRIVLPPQEAFPCNLTFTLQGTPHTIDLSTQINRLAEGTLYVIHINSRGESTLEIVDWQNEHYEILTPTDNNITTD